MRRRSRTDGARSRAATPNPLAKATPNVGRQFEDELLASIMRTWGAPEGTRIPDEKRPQVGPAGERGAFYGETRIADFVVPIPGGRVLFIEAKSTTSPDGRFDLRKLRPSQRQTLKYLRDNGQAAWVVINFRPKTPDADGRMVNETWAVVANTMLQLLDDQASVTLAYLRRFNSPSITGRTTFRIRRALVGFNEWGWNVFDLATSVWGEGAPAPSNDIILEDGTVIRATR